MNQVQEKIHNEALVAAKEYKKAEARLLDVVMRVDTNKVFIALECSSLFEYCVKELGLSESVSYSLMTVARKSKEIPELKVKIESGELSLSKVKRIVPVINKENK